MIASFFVLVEKPKYSPNLILKVCDSVSNSGTKKTHRIDLTTCLTSRSAIEHLDVFRLQG